MDFLLFLLLNAVLFVRPAEFVPSLEALPIYYVVIITCLVVSYVRWLEQLIPDVLVTQPMTVCVVGLLLAVVLSHMVRIDTLRAREEAFEFLKVVLYYLLMVGVLNSARRLRYFLMALVVLTTVVALVAVANYLGYIDIEAMAPAYERWYDVASGEEQAIYRMCGPGIYNDPNDLCLLLVMGIGLSLYFLTDRTLGVFWPIFAGPIVFLGYAMSLTRSRGGLLGLVAGVLVLVVARFGWKRSLPAVVVVVPTLLLLFSGRMTSIDVEAGTGQARIQLWQEGFHLLPGSPLFGIGAGEYAKRVGQVAHNSFVHAYTELGLFGGTCFLGAFYLAGWGLWRLGFISRPRIDPQLWRLRTYLLAVVVGYCAGMFSLSRNYIVPTYMILGLAAVYLRLVPNDPEVPALRLDRRVVKQVGVVGVSGLVWLYLYVKVFVHYG